MTHCTDSAHVVDGPLVKEFGRNNLLNDFLLDLLPQLLSGDLLSVLSGDDDGIDTERDGSTTLLLVLDGDLGLGVRSEPAELSAAASISHGLVKLVGQDDGQWHVFLSFISGITEHDTLVTSSKLLQCLLVMQTLCNVRALLLNGN